MHRLFVFIVLAGAPLLVVDGFSAEPGVVAVIGTGDMGDSLGPRLAELGYAVVYGTRHPASDDVVALVARTGASARATTPAEAAAAARIVFLAVPWPAMESVAQGLGDLSGKIVVDISMPFRQGADGYPERLFETSSAERIQAWNPGARVVKSFATMGSQVIDDPASAGETVSLPIAGDDRSAKEEIAGIVAAMGLDPVDFGPLRMAQQIENLQMIYMIPLLQNRPRNWEFRFLRDDHYGCYLTHSETPEGANPPYDADDLAEFPESGTPPAPCATIRHD